jgi:hypothetical protein
MGILSCCRCNIKPERALKRKRPIALRRTGFAGIAGIIKHTRRGRAELHAEEAHLMIKAGETAQEMARTGKGLRDELEDLQRQLGDLEAAMNRRASRSRGIPPAAAAPILTSSSSFRSSGRS